jgi:hypothetical protein
MLNIQIESFEPFQNLRLQTFKFIDMQTQKSLVIAKPCHENWAYVTIEGPAYFVRSVVLERDSIDAVRLVLSGQHEERLDPSTLVQRAGGALECLVRGDLSAAFDTHAVMQLAPLLEETEAGMAFRGDGGLIVVPDARDPASVAG